jgi:hypothetical protein
MAQYDILLTQNVAASGIEFSEKYINLAKGALLSSNGQDPGVLPPGSAEQMLMPDASSPLGLKWAAIPDRHQQNTDTGTLSSSFQVGLADNGPVLVNSGGKLHVEGHDKTLGDIVSKNAEFDRVIIKNPPGHADDAAPKGYVDDLRDHVDSLLSANDAMVFKGTLGTGGTVTSLPTTHSAGWTYKVVTAGTFAGKVCEVGDMVIAIVNRSGSGNTNNDWAVIQANIDGAVTGPASATNGNFAVFSGTSGKIIANSTFNSGSFAAAAHVGATGNAHGVATTSVNGFMSADDKTKLNGITAGAEPNVGTNLSIGGSNDARTVESSTGSNASIPLASGSTAGFMSRADKNKLDGVAANANNYSHPNEGGGSIPTPLIGASVISAITVNARGHVTGTATRNLTPENIGAMKWVSAPASRTSAGVAGQVAYDGNFFYVCTATNTWKRSAIATNW